MSEDSIVNDVVKKYLERSAVGIQKYGTTLDRNDLSTEDWLTHLQEELMDATLYLERLRKEIIKIKEKEEEILLDADTLRNYHIR